jgi:hypothetical protein
MGRLRGAEAPLFHGCAWIREFFQQPVDGALSAAKSLKHESA